MRIAMISTPFVSVPPQDYGGTELVVYELVEGLADLGHDVTLFATGDSVVRSAREHLYRTAVWPPHALAELNHVSWAMSRIAGNDFDLVHAHSAVALAIARFLPELPLVYTLHHDQQKETSEFYASFPDAYYIAISQNQKDREVPLPSCDVIHHGLSVDRFEWTDQPGDYVCFLARLAEVKGPHLAIDVAQRAGLQIRVAGDVHPPDRQFAERELRQRLDFPHVTYMGTVSVREKIPLLRDARALLAPICWEEPFGLVLIEAMLSGCPAVCFPRGSAPELVEPGVTGFLVHSTDEMADVIRPGGPLDSFDRRRCRERAVERFNRTRLVADHVALYERIIAERRWRAQRSEARSGMGVT